MSDLLLEWMSFKCDGKIEDLPHELLGSARPHRFAEDLSMLGHVEATDGVSWRVAPPALAETTDHLSGPAVATLCGARTAGVLNRLTCAARETGAELITTTVAGKPAVIRMTALSRPVLASTAIRAGIPFQRDAAFTLLACVPSMSTWPRTSCAMVSGRVETVRRFSRSRLTWIDCSLAAAVEAKAGLFRIRRDWDWITILKSSETDCARIDDRAGRFVIAANCRVIAWDTRARTIGFPLHLYPPPIVARALTLCSGSLPLIQERRVVFAGVTPAIVNLTLAVTGLRLA